MNWKGLILNFAVIFGYAMSPLIFAMIGLAVIRPKTVKVASWVSAIAVTALCFMVLKGGGGAQETVIAAGILAFIISIAFYMAARHIITSVGTKYLLAFIISFGIGFAALFGTGYILGNIFNNDEGITLLVAISIGLVTWMLSFMRLGKNKSITDIVYSTVSSFKNVGDAVASRMNENDTPYYAQAEKEIASNNQDTGLWAQSLVYADGNFEKRKIEYMKLRVKQLKRKI